MKHAHSPAFCLNFFKNPLPFAAKNGIIEEAAYFMKLQRKEEPRFRGTTIMNELFSNIWMKRVVSLLSPLYAVGVFWFAYYAVFYDMELLRPMQACVLVSAISIFALVVMLYTREQLITKLTSLLLLPGMLLPVLLYFGQWGVLIPPLVVALVIFFFSGMSETAKTVWGTIFLLLYLLGSLLYFLVTSLFAPSTVTTVVEQSTSPSGIYRCTVTETVDSSNGSTKVSVESNELDKVYDLVVFRIKGLSRDVKIERPLNQDVTLVWQTESRADITQQIEGISEDVTASLSDAQMTLLDRPAYRVTYSDGRSADLMAEDYHNIVVTLTPQQMTDLKTEQSEYMLDELSDHALSVLGITTEDLRTVPFSTLTEDDLIALGIPEQGDVLYYNGKVVFRYYVAILEQYFDISNQDLGLF